MNQIRQLTINDVNALVEHLARHLPEPGVGGIISQPFQADEPIDTEMHRTKYLKSLSITPGDNGWEVVWGVFNGSKIVGHLNLTGSQMIALRHRAKLGIGIESMYRSQGLGRMLMETAIAWAKTKEFLVWIDLDVFAHNIAAINLYKSFGFTLRGKTVDRIRVNNQSIDDCQFTLNLFQRNHQEPFRP